MRIIDAKSKCGHMEGEFSFEECTRLIEQKGTAGNLCTLRIKSEPDSAMVFRFSCKAEVRSRRVQLCIKKKFLLSPLALS